MYTSLSHANWKNTKLVDVATYDHIGFPATPLIPTTGESTTGTWRVLIGDTMMHETHPDGDVGTVRITNTRNIMQNLEINSFTTLSQFPSGVPLTLGGSTSERVMRTTGIRTHFFIKFATNVTIFERLELDDDDSALMISISDEHVVASVLADLATKDAIQTDASSDTNDGAAPAPRLVSPTHDSLTDTQCGDEHVQQTAMCHLPICTHATPHWMDHADASRVLDFMGSANHFHNERLVDDEADVAPIDVLFQVDEEMQISDDAGINVFNAKPDDFPAAIQAAMKPWLNEMKHGSNETDGQTRYRNVRPYVGNRSTQTFRGYQVQIRQPPGVDYFLGAYASTTVGAMVAFAKTLDDRIINSKTAKRWVGMMTTNPKAAEAWLGRVRGNILGFINKSSKRQREKLVSSSKRARR